MTDTKPTPEDLERARDLLSVPGAAKLQRVASALFELREAKDEIRRSWGIEIAVRKRLERDLLAAESKLAEAERARDAIGELLTSEAKLHAETAQENARLREALEKVLNSHVVPSPDDLGSFVRYGIPPSLCDKAMAALRPREGEATPTTEEEAGPCCEDHFAPPDEARHVCGLMGFNPMIDPPCPACSPFKCVPCGMGWESENDYAEHLQQVHKTDWFATR